MLVKDYSGNQENNLKAIVFRCILIPIHDRALKVVGFLNNYCIFFSLFFFFPFSMPFSVTIFYF